MTNDITLDDAKLAEIEAAARKAEPGEWLADYAGDLAWVASNTLELVEGSANECAHIVATQPRVALALVAEIRRLRDIIETIRALRDDDYPLRRVIESNHCTFWGAPNPLPEGKGWMARGIENIGFRDVQFTWTDDLTDRLGNKHSGWLVTPIDEALRGEGAK